MWKLRLTAGLVGLLLGSAPAFAIPSPEVVVSFFSNTAQIFGLLTLAVGGAFFSRQRVSRRRGGAIGAGNIGIGGRGIFAILAVLLVASAGVNVLQWSWSADEKLERLSTNLLRASKEAGQSVGDVSLKTLGFSDQVSHPQGISTAELEQILESAESGDGEPINFIDVREDEEWETAQLDGFRHTRYPDVLARIEALSLPGRKNVLLCHSGNRSSELCDVLAKRGIDCRFVVGGYEKWIAERRAVARLDGQIVSSLRGIPTFPNDGMLLDTADVRQMVDEEGAIFVDVRYPADFERGHLPGAINLPIRKLPSTELVSGLSEIPRQPVIAPCYDKRSCFYSKILGLRLTRRGYDFRGRYTVPHEYLTETARRPHVESWLKANENSVLGQVQQPAIAVIEWLSERFGNLILAIFAVVVLLRLVMLPLTMKGERDQIVQRRVVDRLAALRAKYTDNPRLLKASIHQLYRQNGLTPGRNVLGLIVQVLCLVVLFSAVSAVTTEGSGRFLWIADIASADPYFALPAVLAGLVYLQLEIGASRHTVKLALLRLLGGGVFALITVQLKAALVLYLIFGLLLMIVQNLAIRVAMARHDQEKAPLPERVAPLRYAHRIAGAGRKAQRLGELIQAGIPVPPGLVIPHGAFPTNGQAAALDAASKKLLLKLCRRMKLRSMAVRSSGASEDGGDRSYAGVFESVLNVDRDGLEAAIAEVRQSFARSAETSYGDGDTSGGVIVQAMIDAEYAGILFSEHPSHSGALLVEMTEGLGDSLASGTGEPTSFAFGRLSGRLNGDGQPPIDLAPLIALAMQIEELFGQPQDLEWAYWNGRFYILQARNITALERLGDAMTPSAIFERERHRLLELARSVVPDDVALAQNELSELLPRPTPLSVSFMEEMWKPGGSVDLACHSLGVPYEMTPDCNPMIVSVFGSLYVNMHEQRRRIRKGIGPLAAFRLSRSAESIERDFRETFLPDYLSELRLLEAMDFNKVPISDLIGLIEDTADRYFHDSHVQVDLINIAADFFVKAAERAMRKRGLNSGAILGQGNASVMHQAMDLIQKLRHGEASPEEFLAVFGHRSTVDYELSLPRYREDLSEMEALIRGAAMLDEAANSNRSQAETPDDPTLALMIMRGQRFQSLKEEAKHYSLREFAVIRRMFVELDRRLGLDGGIFFLEFGEIADLRIGGQIDAVKQRIERRRAASAFFETIPPFDPSITLRDLETMAIGDTTHHDETGDSGVLAGSLVAGSEPAVGRARVLSGQDIQSIQDGEIAVARYMHPSWTPVFPRLRGIVTEVGGWLSHTSILAREFGVTTIIGVKAAEYRIETGDLLRLNLDGTVDVLERAAGTDQEPETAETGTHAALSAGQDKISEQNARVGAG